MKKADIEGFYVKGKERLDKLSPVLAPNTVTILNFDLDSLWNQYQSGAGNREKIAPRLKDYWMILKFFELRVEAHLPTDLVGITTADVESFLEQLGVKSREKPKGKKLTTVQINYRTALNGFFQRALENNQINVNPVTSLYTYRGPLEPHWTPQNTTDYQNFEKYLKQHKKQLSKNTIEILVRFLRYLFYDADRWHATNPEWPLQLDGIFSDPKWVYEWLNNTTNHAPNAKASEVTVGTTEFKLVFVKKLFHFLKRQKRCQNLDFLQQLDGLLVDEDGDRNLPGLPERARGRISAQERAQVYARIDEYTQKKRVLGLRDKAIFETGITAAMRSGSLHDMRIENIKSSDNHRVCDVKVKRLRTKGRTNQQKMPDGSARGEWYVSPAAWEAIGEYLKATERDWNSTGPIWLGRDGSPLTLGQLQAIIRRWLGEVDCEYQNPHALRHTGCSILLNEAGLSISETQQITHHLLASTLLNTYVHADKRAAFTRADKAHPMKEDGVEPEEIDCPSLIKKLAMELNELATKILQHEHEGYAFRSEHVQQLHKKFAEWLRKADGWLLAHPPKNSPGRKARPIT